MPCTHTYDYFQNPDEDSTWSERPQECGCCGERCPGFAGPFEGDEVVEFVCEHCLKDGQLGDLGAIINNVDFDQLQVEVITHDPALSPDKLGEIVEERFSEVAERTPPIAGASDSFTWPFHCGDLCRFVGPDEENDFNFECSICGAMIVRS